MREKPFSEMLETPMCDGFPHGRPRSNFKGNSKLPSAGVVNFTYGDLQKMKREATKCAICEKPFDSAHLGTDKKGDHDHETGILRGILCLTCNTTLGFYEKFQRNPDLVARFEKYLGGKK